MKYCGNCTRKLSDNVDFCPMCGKAVSAFASHEPKIPTNETANHSGTNPKSNWKNMRRIAVVTVAVAVIVALIAWGIVSLHANDGKYSAPVTSAASKKQGTKKTRETVNGAEIGWRGLHAAGIPVPGDWSQRTKAFPVDTHRDGSRTLAENTDGITLHDDHGPIDTALETVNALLDPNGSDEEWRNTVFKLIGDDGAGESHPVPDAPRWWWAQRRFDPNSVCSGQFDDSYLTYAYSCPSIGKWDGTDTDAIQSQPYWPKDTDFPIPEGAGLASTQDPQFAVGQAYNTMLIPMDDGNWHVTVYCPAALDSSLLDKDANELDPNQVKAGDESYTVIAATGYGTVQHPCRTVEVVVGGQKPFWSLQN